MSEALLASMFAEVQGLSIRQSRELAEILVGFDVANRYRVVDGEGQQRGEVIEERGGLTGMLLRNLLGVWRGQRLHLRNADGVVIATFSKGLSFFFHRLDVSAGGVVLGSITRTWSLLGRKFVVRHADGRELARVKRPLWRIWTYPVLDPSGEEIARIGKRWGGLLTEVFTDADTYGVAYTSPASVRLRVLLFASMFLIDMTNTEDNANAGGLLGGSSS